MNRSPASLQSVLLEPRMVRAIVLFVCAGVALYLAAMFWFGWKETAAALGALGPMTLLIGAFVASSSYLWRFARWEHALRHLGHTVPRRQHLAIYLSGLALTATPGKSGETFRSALLVQRGVRFAHSLAAFITDRASDVLGMCLLGLVAAWTLGKPLAWAWLGAFAALLLGSSLFAYVLSRPRTAAAWAGLGRALQWRPVQGGQAVLESWAIVWTLPRVIAFAGAAMLAYGSQALVFAWFCHAAGTSVTAADCVLIFVQATLFGAATMAPGGLGAMEAALVLQLTERGVGYGTAVSLAIAIRLVTLWLGMAIGVISLLSSSTRKTDDPAR